MHTLIKEWNSARATMAAVEETLIHAVKVQFEMEKAAYLKAYGIASFADGVSNIYTIKVDYYKVDDSDVVAMCYGRYGGEDYSPWRRTLLDVPVDGVPAHYEAQFKYIIDHKKKEMKEIREARRQELLNELALIDAQD